MQTTAAGNASRARLHLHLSEMNDHLHLRSISTYWPDARAAEIQAFHLARAGPDAVRDLIAIRAWIALLPLACLVEHDMPRDFAQTDPALYRTIRKALTELHCGGLGYMRAESLLAELRRTQSGN
jgi:hypothetical protein